MVRVRYKDSLRGTLRPTDLKENTRMSLSEKLLDFKGAISTSAINAPDEYPEWSYITYESNMADIKELWVYIHPQIKKNIEQVEFVDEKLNDMFMAFDQGDKEGGQQAAWDIYNSEVEKLR